MITIAEEKEETQVSKVTIKSARESARFVKPGVVDTVVNVTYVLDNGHVGTLTIPKEQYTEEEVKRRIKEGLVSGVDLIGKELEL